MKKLLNILLPVLLPCLAAAGENFRFTCRPYLQNVTDSTATVVWATDRDAIGWVELAPDDSTHFYASERPCYFATTLGKKDITRIHRVTVTGLRPATNYRYRVYSKEVTRNVNRDTRYGAVLATDVYRGKPLRFRTSGGMSSGKIHFAVVNDIHEHAGRFGRLFSHVDSASLDFMVLNGDMVNTLDSLSQAYGGFLNSSSDMFASSIPFFMVRGNHETRGTQSQRYMELFPSSTGMPYYAVRRGDVCMLMLDAGEDKPDSDIEYSGLAAFDDYRTQEARWLAGVVASDMFRTAPVRIVFIHVPPIGNGWHGLQEVRRKFIPILNRAGIHLMLSGHIHRHEFIPAGQREFGFPLLVNSNREILDVQASAAGIDVRILDRNGETKKTFNFPVNTL